MKKEINNVPRGKPEMTKEMSDMLLAKIGAAVFNYKQVRVEDHLALVLVEVGKYSLSDRTKCLADVIARIMELITIK